MKNHARFKWKNLETSDHTYYRVLAVESHTWGTLQTESEVFADRLKAVGFDDLARLARCGQLVQHRNGDS